MQVLLALRARHFAGVVEHGFQRAVLFQQLPGELRARSAARPARCPPRRPPGPGNRPPARARFPIRRAARRGRRPRSCGCCNTFTRSVINWRQSLSPVTRKHWPPSWSVTSGDGGQHVVGLVRLAVQRRNAQGGDHPANGRNLRHQVVGHFGPLDLVLIVHRVAKGLARQVERAEQVVRPLLLQQVEQIAGEAEHGPHRLALRAGHLRQGVKHLVDQRVGVDDPDRSPGQALRRRGPMAGRCRWRGSSRWFGS